MRRFDGVAPPVVTPFRDGELAEDWLRQNLVRLSTTGLSGILVLGSNGEAAHLSPEEKRRVMEIGREAVPRDLWFMAGTGEATTGATLNSTRDAAERGADAVLVAPPFYYKESMKGEVLRSHYLEVAEGSPVPVLLYNVPQFTGLNLEPSLVARLAEHPNIVGIKDSSGNIAQLTEIRRLTSPEFNVFVGSAPVFLAALCIGAGGGILAAANVLPEAFVRLHRLFGEGAMVEARKLQWDLMAVSRAVTVDYGIGGLKAAMEMAGYLGGAPRPPLALPDEAGMGRLRELLRPFQ